MVDKILLQNNIVSFIIITVAPSILNIVSIIFVNVIILKNKKAKE